MKTKNALMAIVVLCSAVSVTHGGITVQELFDNISSGDATLNGAGDTTTSVGMTGTWATSGVNGTQIYTANNFNVGGSLPGLPSNGGALGGVYFNAWQFPVTWDTDIYATRPLASSINFGASQTLYFSVRLNNAGDTAMGLGLASGANGSAEFVGAGFMWNTATGLDSLSANNSLYLSAGTLDQDLTGNNNGPYAILAHTAAGTVNGPALLAGRLTLAATGADLVDVKLYKAGDMIDPDPSAISWSLQGGIDSSMSASHLLLWLNGSGQGELDAIRIGESWLDVTGVPEPSAAVLGGLGVLMLVILRRRR